VQHEVHLAHVLEPQEIAEVVDVRRHADVARQLMAAVTLSRQRRREDDVARSAQPFTHVSPTPAAVHRSVHQHERRHRT
jgi:hypothetical protein